MIGSGIPRSHNNAPRPKPMTFSFVCGKDNAKAREELRVHSPANRCWLVRFGCGFQAMTDELGPISRHDLCRIGLGHAVSQLELFGTALCSRLAVLGRDRGGIDELELCLSKCAGAEDKQTGNHRSQKIHVRPHEPFARISCGFFNSVPAGFDP
jgi:hypothetical protein